MCGCVHLRIVDICSKRLAYTNENQVAGSRSRSAGVCAGARASHVAGRSLCTYAHGTLRAAHEGRAQQSTYALNHIYVHKPVHALIVLERI
jgi:hypothetical protein